MFLNERRIQFWLARVHRTNDAVRFLEDGLRCNPGNAALEVDFGHDAVRLRHAGGSAAGHEHPSPRSANGDERRLAPADLHVSGGFYGKVGCTNLISALRAGWLTEFPSQQVPRVLHDVAR